MSPLPGQTWLPCRVPQLRPDMPFPVRPEVSKGLQEHDRSLPFSYALPPARRRRQVLCHAPRRMAQIIVIIQFSGAPDEHRVDRLCPDVRRARPHLASIPLYRSRFDQAGDLSDQPVSPGSGQTVLPLPEKPQVGEDQVLDLAGHSGYELNGSPCLGIVQPRLRGVHRSA